ncbi:MAG: M28 family peptidase [Anaerolineae bacterium]|nr:M28 family peptidase [Anaerolineae bacterium]
MTFSKEKLCETIRMLSVEIGPRQAASPAERAAAGYVQKTLLDFGLTPEVQTYASINSFSKRLFTQELVSAAVLAAGMKSTGQVRRFLGLAGLGLALHDVRLWHGRPALWDGLLPRGQTQNVVARIPARHTSQNRIVVVAHLDTSQDRITAHPKIVQHLPNFLGWMGIPVFLGGFMTLFAPDNRWTRFVKGSMVVHLLLGGILSLIDEIGDPIAGANANASGAAVLLGLAEYLAQNPLPSTEVWCVFTGGAEAGCTGIEHFLQKHAAELWDARFVVLNRVGTGELCWVTDHSLSPAVHYQPDADTACAAEIVARQHPEWGIMGRPMMTLDELANVRQYNFKGLCLMGYDRVTGLSPNWHRETDQIEHINPEAVHKAAEFTLALLKKLDSG